MARSPKPPRSSPKAGPAPPPLSLGIQLVPLDELHFDERNPRFADATKEGEPESAILDYIVKTFGVEDVISSISVNGYLSAEPLVGIRQPGGGIRVAEGNRRLAALLILAGDPRARNQERLAAGYPLSAGVSVETVPVVAYDAGTEPAELLPYLGVRHIVGPRQWDSYAKAAWVANVLSTGNGAITLQQIERMTGDGRGAIRRMLEGYYLVDQVRRSQLFNFEDSTKKGRGTAATFPFSWVYNVLGYTNARKWVGMPDSRIGPDPVLPDKVSNAAELMRFMFGQKAGGQPAAIDESRDLSDLATCLGNDALVARLRNGEKVERVLWVSKAGRDKFLQSITAADSALGEAAAVIPELSRDDAHQCMTLGLGVATKARAVQRSLSDKASGLDADAE